jgi:hypothetical protein
VTPECVREKTSLSSELVWGEVFVMVSMLLDPVQHFASLWQGGDLWKFHDSEGLESGLSVLPAANTPGYSSWKWSLGVQTLPSSLPPCNGNNVIWKAQDPSL